MPLTREAIVIHYWPLDPEQCLYILEAITEGVTQANMVEIETGAPDFEGLAWEGVRYEKPVVDLRDGQHIGTLSEVLHKGRATCIEAAAIAAARIRLANREADAVLVPQKDAYGKEIPWKYHCVVKLPDGTFIDPTVEIQQGQPVVGACCGSCAVGAPCESDCHEHDHHHHGPSVGHGACCDSCAAGLPCESECPDHDHHHGGHH